MLEHHFGGDWTQEKLARLAKYLKAYTTIFHANERARHLQTIYVDAFAGTGYITSEARSAGDDVALFPELAEPETQGFLKGSAQRALEVEPAFDHFIFVEKEPAYAQELHRLRLQHYHIAHKIEVVRAEANAFLTQWCHTNLKKQKQRAVVFLDPYSLEVEWDTLCAIAETEAIDLWLLWPIGQTINRLLPRRHLPPVAWAKSLTTAFGTDEWERRFYGADAQPQLDFSAELSEPTPVKVAGFKEIEQFFIERLQTIFAQVAPKPLWLRNSQNTPLYLLCFAAHNPKAVKIAQDILQK